MDIMEYRDFCLSLPAVEEAMPFAAFPGGDDVLVYKVGGKMFTLTRIDNFESVYVKCTPEDVEDMRERYEDVTHAKNMNPRHWVALKTAGRLDDDFIRRLIRDSYRLVVGGLPKRLKEEISRQGS